MKFALKCFIMFGALVILLLSSKFYVDKTMDDDDDDDDAWGEMKVKPKGEDHLRRLLSTYSDEVVCEGHSSGKAPSSMSEYNSYFAGMDKIHQNFNKKLGYQENCLAYHKQCGFSKKRNDLPSFVLSVGLEGAGHHLWTELMGKPLHDCVWINARHYNRNIGSGVPRLTTEDLAKGFYDHFKLRRPKPACKFIYDAEDSFPTGAIRLRERLFMRPDLVNLQELDGKLFDVKYLLIVRNTTDTLLSSLRRNFFTEIDTALRTVEHTLTYIESSLKRVPCGKVFIAHYEHVLADPMAYHQPLVNFLELDTTRAHLLKERLEGMNQRAKLPKRKVHELRQYKECGGGGGANKAQQRKGDISIEECYKKVTGIIDRFMKDRHFMWPSFAGNGFLYK
jgi:hypothetical protein